MHVQCTYPCGELSLDQVITTACHYRLHTLAAIKSFILMEINKPKLIFYSY